MTSAWRPRPAHLALLGAYLVLVALYAWQAWQRQTPTLFTDEIEFTQISRSIAETGRAALRGGEPAPGASLYQYLVAPAWWLDGVSAAYGAIKLAGVLLMTAVIFPAYALARTVVSRPYALFAAVGAAVAPALAYAPFLVEEPLAYPVSTLALLLIARAAVAPTPWTLAAAVAACGAGALVRSQLAVLFVVLALVFLARAWRGEQARRRRASWSRGDWVGGAVLLLGLAVVLSAFMGRRSFSWYVSTAFFKERMLEYGIWALGALGIGIGLVPLIGGLVALVRPRGEPRDERVDAFVALSASSLAVFCFYTAVKTAYLSTYFAVVIAERNLIYLVPLLFAGTALVLERRRYRLAVLAAATVLVAYVVSATPHSLSEYPNYEAHGLAIGAFANRILRWPAETIETTLVVIAIGAGLLVALVGLLGRTRLATGVVVGLGALTLAWSLTTEVYAAHGEQIASDRQYSVLATPPSWVDALTGGERTALVGQGMSDPNPIWQLEFWNRSIEYFMGLDGSAPGPGQTATPNLDDPDGTQAPSDLGAEYAVAVGGVAIAAPKLTTVGGVELYRLGGEPVRLREAKTGVASDGWMGERATYTRYDGADLPRGYVKVFLSREAACFPNLPPAVGTVEVGPVAIDTASQPSIGRVTARRQIEVFACQPNPVVLPVPAEAWRVEVQISPTFVPRELDPGLGDARQLGAKLAFELIPFGD